MEIPFFKSAENLPKNLGPLEFVGHEKYEDERLGIGMRYQHDDPARMYPISKFDAYMYNLGYEKIPEIIFSSFFMAAAENDLGAVMEYYKDYEEFKFEDFWFSREIQEQLGRPAWIASMSFYRTFDDIYKVKFNSYYLLTGFDNYFIKFRTTVVVGADDIFNPLVPASLFMEQIYKCKS